MSDSTPTPDPAASGSPEPPMTPPAPSAPPAGPPAPPAPPSMPAPPAPPAYLPPAPGAPMRPGFEYTAVPTARPGAVTAAAVITWISCALQIVFSLGVAAMSSVPEFREGFAEGAVDEGLKASDVDAILGVLVGFSIVVAVISAVVMVIAGFAFRGSGGARVTVMIFAGLTAVLGLLSFPFGLLWTAAGVAVIVLLAQRTSSQWFEAKRAGRI